ncbi:efflux RND transporter periplasmic adaptor subunit [Patescibacteria group bacterium]|nr:efflux RND transporter periplasmic adaptor subunit [Patescibacteria group bacterium]
MKTKLNNIFKIIIDNKKLFAAVLVAVLFIGFFGWQYLFTNGEESSYTTKAVEIGDLKSIVPGTGQVVVSSQIDIKPQASGVVVYVATTNGQYLKKWDLIAQLDISDAQKTVRDAEINLENAKNEYNKFIEPADELSILQAENDLSQAREKKINAESDLEKTYEDGYNTVSSAFLDLPGIISGLNDLLFLSTLSDNQWNIDYYYSSTVNSAGFNGLALRDLTYDNYQVARNSYDESFDTYKNISRYSSEDLIESIILKTYNTSKAISDSVKTSNNLIQFYQDELSKISQTPKTLSNQHLITLDGYTSKINSHLSSLLNIKNTISTSKEDIINAERDIVEKEKTLKNLIDGPDEFDLETKKLSLQQKENSLADAKEKLSDYYIVAPFNGIITGMDLRVGDSVSSGSVASLVSVDKFIETSLNEADISQIKLGQKVTITFDAIEDFEIEGEISEIDVLGTVNQGVVEYGVKISFDDQDSRIKPGMSASVDIVVESRENVLLIPNSAIKGNERMKMVQVLKDNEIVNTKVETGLTNDILTEIISGLNEGDLVITQTSSTVSTSLDKSSAPEPGSGGGGGNNDAMRMMRQIQ